MKKIFALTHAKLKPARLVDSIKHDIKKYISRERNKPLPEGMDYWTFDCRFGASEDVAEEVYPSDINKRIDAAVEQELTEIYIEVLSRSEEHKPRAVEAEGEGEAEGDAEFDDDFFEDEDED